MTFTPGAVNRLAGLLISVIVLIAAVPGISSATNISLVGSWQFSQSGSTVVLSADRIQNNSAGGQSGSLRMELWAFSHPFNGTASGYEVTGFDLGQLSGGAALTNVSSGSIAFVVPPSGLYYFSMLLREYNGTAYQTDSYYNYKPPIVCASTSGCYYGNMTFHGGSVQHSQKVYTIFWNPSGPAFVSGYQAAINQFIQDLRGS